MKYFLLLCLICLSTFASQAKTPSRDEVKVISYNIRFVNKKDGANIWQNRAKASPAMIKDYAPDVFGVQEALFSQLEYLDEKLPQYSFVGVGREDGKKKGETMAIFYNTRKVRLLDWGTYWLSETPDKPSRGWDADCKRTATWTLMEMKGSGKKFFYVNTHLDHRGDMAQQKGLELILERIAAMNPEGLPMILTGDFNVEPDAPVLYGLNAKMTDARMSALKTDSRATFNAWGKSASIIDYIYHSGFSECAEYETIVRQYKDVLYISDHYPIVSRLVF
jgi:endonuclease/exonuclease/phosphatase family metal-dependent hydrolase